MRTIRVAAAVLGAAVLWGQNVTVPPQGARGRFTIRILDGDDAILNTRDRVARESIVQVEDENHRPVGGVLLSFTSPDTGASATFHNGSHFATIVTDDRGRVALRGIRPNRVAGRYSIRITASQDGRTGSAQIQMTNVVPPAPPAGIFSTKVILIVAGAAAAAGTGIAIAKLGGGGGTPPQGPSVPPSTLTLQAGAPGVGPPR
jgi:hypothetical protein